MALCLEVFALNFDPSRLSGASGLLRIVKKESADHLKDFIKIGMHVDSREWYTKESLLQWAVKNGKHIIVKYLISHGASVNLQDYKKRAALHYACEQGSRYIIESLLKAGARCDFKDDEGWTSLHCAAKSGSLEIVQQLVSKVQHNELQRYLNAETRDGFTALDIAWFDDHSNVVHYLMNEGAKTKFLLHVLTLHDDKRGVDRYLRKLKNKSGDEKKKLLQQVDGDGNTPLHVAALHNRTNIARRLLRHGVDVNITQNNSDGGATPLQLAAQNGSRDVVELLIKKGAQRYNEKRLHDAAVKGDWHQFKQYYQLGAKLTSSEEQGRTKLHGIIEKQAVYTWQQSVEE